MFTISPTSYAWFTNEAERKFVLDLVTFLRQNVPELAGEPADAMIAQVTLLLEQARSYGLMSEQHVAVFALTAAQLGTDFVEKFPGAREILTLELSADEKVSLLEAFTLNLFEILAA